MLSIQKQFQATDVTTMLMLCFLSMIACNSLAKNYDISIDTSTKPQIQKIYSSSWQPQQPHLFT